MTRPHGAVFISHASEDAEVAARVCAALRAAGVEVWFDQSELRGGDAWDRQIRRQIHDCALFVAMISAHTDARTEGYFRREWRLAVERTHDMADDAAFLLPVVVDDTSEASARVPEPFRDVQWTHLSGADSTRNFVARVLALLATNAVDTRTSGRPLAATTHAANSIELGAISVNAPVGRRFAPALWLLGAAALILAGWLAFDRLRTAPRGGIGAPATAGAVAVPAASGVAGAVPEKSIAVLPFLDMSEKHDQEYFSDGLTEELIDRLANLPGLHVPARTSSFHFKGQNTTIPEIGRTLSVAHVLEGSVRKSGETLRITAQLIRVADGYHLWSKTYDRQMKDIFHVQDDIADQVVQALQVTLAGPAPQNRSRTDSVAAHNLLLQGNFFVERSGEGDSDRAIALYEAATKADPRYALAWAGLAWALIWKYPVEDPQRIDQTAKKAIELDPDLAEAHAVHGWYYSLFAYDWLHAAEEYDRALALEPQTLRALSGKGQLARLHGKFDEAIRYYEAASARDPVDPSYIEGLAHTLLCAGRAREAADRFRRALEISPNYATGHSFMAWILFYAGDPQAALRENALEPIKNIRLANIALIEGALHHQRESDAALRELIALDDTADSVNIAAVYAARGDAASAVTWLERGLKARGPGLSEAAHDPDFWPIRGDARFKAFLRKINLPG